MLRMLILNLVGARGFEPPTSRSQTERTTRLCYAPNSMTTRASEKKRRYILASGGISGQVSQEFMCLFQRTMSVTDLILNFWWQLREGHF